MEWYKWKGLERLHWKDGIVDVNGNKIRETTNVKMGNRKKIN